MSMAPLRAAKRAQPARLLWSGLACLVLGAPAQAQLAIGSAEKIEKTVTGTLNAPPRRLSEKDPVFRNEQVKTEQSSQARLRFSDQTDLRIGPSSSVKLDAFVFSGEAGSATEITKGALRFVSGQGPKGSYAIKTPVATIGLRGTIVDVVVRGRQTFVTLHEGAAQICTLQGVCVEITNQCQVVAVNGTTIQPARLVNASTPTFNSVCRGEICGAERCENATPTRATPTPPRAVPPKAKPPKANPPKAAPQTPKRPVKKRVRRAQSEEFDVIDEPAPRRPGLLDVLPLVPSIGIGGGRFGGGGRVPTPGRSISPNIRGY